MSNEDFCKTRFHKVPTIQATEGKIDVNADTRELIIQNQVLLENHT
jgi:hypothetical protein